MTRAKKYLNAEYKVSDQVPAPTDRLNRPMDISLVKRKMELLAKTRNSKCIIPQRIIHLTEAGYNQQQVSSVYSKIENTAKAGAGVIGGLLGNVAAFSQNMFMMKKRSTYIPT